MARAKFKPGTLVKIDEGNGESFDVVTGVMTRENGFAYEVGGNMVNEEHIQTGYREIVQRKASAPKVKKTKKSKMASESATVQ